MSVSLKSQPVMVTASVLSRHVPGLFKFSLGANPRTVYIDREFDDTDKADAADAAYEEAKKKYDRGDYSYPGAYPDPEYAAKRAAWVAFNEKKRTLEQDLRNAKRNDLAGLDWYGPDREKRREIEERYERITKEQVDALLKAEGNPEEVSHRTPAMPTHAYKNRIFRIDLSDRLIEYYNAEGKRARIKLESCQPVNQYDKMRLMNSGVEVDGTVGAMVKAGCSPQHPDNETKLVQSIVMRQKSGQGGRLGYSDRRVLTRIYDPEQTSWNDPDRETEISMWISGWEQGQVPDEALAPVEEWLDERMKMLQQSELYINAIKEAGQAGYYEDWDIPKDVFDQIRVGQALPYKYRYDSDGDPQEPWLPARYAAKIPHMRTILKKTTDAWQEHFWGDERAHQARRGGEMNASDFWGGTSDVDFYPIAAQLAVAEAHKYEEYAREHQRKINLRNNATPQDCPQIPHLKDDIRFFPHQALAMAKLDACEENAIIDIDMGGGKTVITMVADAMLAVSKGIASRPMVVMPTGGGTLVPQQIEEIRHKFGENVNVIALTSQSWGELGDDEEERKEEAKRIITSAPPNTVILATYSFFSKSKDGKQQVWRGKTYSRNTKKHKKGDPVMEWEFLRGPFLIDECGVDMVTLDECHRIKNPQSQTNQAICTLSGARVKRIASGTVFPNTPADIFGQMKFLDPTFFGTWEEFCEKYDLEQDGYGSVVAYSQDSLKRIRQDLIDHQGMISMRRSYWMGMMPQRVEKRHAVRLSPLLQKLYNRIWAEILDQLTNPDNPHYDAKAAAMWEAVQSNSDNDDDEDDDSKGKGEAALLHKIQVLTQFLTAPTASIGGPFEVMEDGEKVDRTDEIPKVFIQIRQSVARMARKDPASTISPKVGKIGEIIESHFKSADSVMSDGSVGKVIVFCQHIESAAHIAKHLPRYTPGISANNIVTYRGGQHASLEAFKTDDDIKVLVAVDHSLTEGHNLQIANRAIRADVRWSPGPTEQVFGRVFRPGSKAAKVFIDTIVTEGTGEVAKYGRLLCKYHAMRKVNSDFSDSTELEPISMNPTALSPFDETGTNTNEEAITELSKIKEYIERYDAAYQFDLDEAKTLSAKLGNEFIDRSKGGQIPGAERIQGWLPHYDDDDLLVPFRCKLYPAKGSKKKSFVTVDDEWTFNVIEEDNDARPLGLKLGTKGGSSFWTRDKPNMKKWIAKIFDMGYTVFECTEMNGKGQPVTVKQYDEDGDVIAEYSPETPPPWKQSSGKAVRPKVEDVREDEEDVPTAPEVEDEPEETPPPPPEDDEVDFDEPEAGDSTPAGVQPESISGGWEICAVQDMGVVTDDDGDSQHEAYAIYRKQTKKGWKYVCRFHYDVDARDTVAEDIRGFDEVGVKVCGISSTADQDIHGLPTKVLQRIQQKIIGYAEELDDSYTGWAWANPAHSPLMGGTPPVKAKPPKDKAPPQPEVEEVTPDNVIEALHVVTLDGITYIAVDSAENDAENLREYGFLHFNSFTLRRFKNVTQSRKALDAIKKRGGKVKDEDLYLNEANRSIRGLKLKGLRKRAREQLLIMRKLRRKGNKKPLELHVVRVGATWHCGVRATESPKQLAKVKAAGRFNLEHHGYWSQCLQRSDAKKLVRALAKNGYQVGNWAEFVGELEEVFSYTPDEDLTLVQRPPTIPPVKPNSGAAPDAIQQPVDDEDEGDGTPDAGPPGSADGGDVPDPGPVIDNEGSDGDDSTPVSPEDAFNSALEQVEESGDEEVAYNVLSSLSKGDMYKLAKKLGYRGDKKRKAMMDFFEEKIGEAYNHWQDYGGGEDDDEGVEEPPAPSPEPAPEPASTGPSLPPIPVVQNPDDPLAGVQQQLEAIYTMLGVKHR